MARKMRLRTSGTKARAKRNIKAGTKYERHKKKVEKVARRKY